MQTRITINNDILTWGISRAGFDLHDFTEKHPRVKKWLKGEKKPTAKQLEAFSKKIYLPFGYFFLEEPPEEKLPIPYFRSNGKIVKKIDLNVLDTILLLQQRQTWLREYLKENSFKELSFVGRFKNRIDFGNMEEVVTDMRQVLNLDEFWAREFKNWETALGHLVQSIEEVGVVCVFNGVVGNNNYRPIPLEVCRGFVLVDDWAPFMFINNADFKSAQMFTIVHELAHVWTGQSAGFDFRKLQPADAPIEKLCDSIAAEFLVPEKAFNETWKNSPNPKQVANKFKVSEIVVARRALDTGKWTKKEFFAFYNSYRKRFFEEKEKNKGGGDFYATTKKRLSPTFAHHVNQAVKTGKLLYRDAYKLTGLKGDTFENFFSNHL